MRYGVYVSNSAKTAKILLDKVVSGDVIVSNQTIKGFLSDIITLHEEVVRAEEQIDHWRTRALAAEKQQPELWQYKIHYKRGQLLHNEDFVGTEEEANTRLEAIKGNLRNEMRSVSRRRTHDPADDRYSRYEEVQV